VGHALLRKEEEGALKLQIANCKFEIEGCFAAFVNKERREASFNLKFAICNLQF
jgi:hypothetical protein